MSVALSLAGTKPVRMARALLLFSGVTFSACAVGPDFEQPAAPDVARVSTDPLPPDTSSAEVAGGAVQHFRLDRDIPAEWWTLFHSQALNDLVAAAIKGNPSLDAAKATLRQAEENLYAGEGALFPTL